MSAWKGAVKCVDLIRNASIHTDRLPVATTSPAGQDMNSTSTPDVVTVRHRLVAK